VEVDTSHLARRSEERLAEAEQRVSEGSGLGEIEPAQAARHQKRAKFMVGDVARCIGVNQRTPLTGVDPPAIALTFYETLREH
jgi:hypothetical protein